MIAHVVEEKLEVEKVRRKIGFFRVTYVTTFLCTITFFLENFFSLLLFGNFRDILDLCKLFLR
jgi:hypothetical protein